jgi:actin-related protein 8
MDVDIIGEVKEAAETSKPQSSAQNRLNIDIPFEASKLPLDVAIFNSTRAAGGHDKIRKYLQAVLVIGGTALVPGMSHALESRYDLCISSLLCIAVSNCAPWLQTPGYRDPTGPQYG